MAKKAKARQDKDRKSKIVMLVLLLIAAAAAGVTVWALFFRSPAPELAPDYAPKKAEEYAEPADAETEEKMEVSEGGGAVSMIYKKEAAVSLSENMVSLMFQNPSKSVNDIVLQLVLAQEDGTETVLAQSGTLHPGYKVEQLELMKEAAKLAEGTYTGRFHVLYYDPDTAEKAVLDGSIEDIRITVTK